MAELETMVLDIDKNDYIEADFMSRRFVNAETRNRAYINVLGAELFIRYLADNGYNTEDIVSMHSISKVLEDVDIADILLPNVHLDVRAIFNEDKIFIPKSHFELDITPDIYIVLKFSKNLKEATFLGYFKPSQVNKKYANDEYYFIPKEHLSTPDTFFKTLSKYKTIKEQKLDAKDFLKGRALSVALSDHNLNNAERKELYRLMLTDSMLRDSVSEFDNFEVLSSQVSSVLLERIELKEKESKAVPGIAALTTEEILKEGIEAAITEKTAEATEVFDAVTESAETVTDVVEATANVADVFEAAPEDEPSVNVENVNASKTAPTLEILNPDEEQEPQMQSSEEEEKDSSDSQDDKEEQEQPEEEKDETPNAEPANEEVSQEQTEAPQDEDITEEELSLGDIDDEITLDEDLAVSDLDTLDTEEVAETAETITEEEKDETTTAEPANEEVSQEQTEAPQDEDITEEELSLGDIDDEITLDEDLAVSDLDTLDTEEVAETAETITEEEKDETTTAELANEEVSQEQTEAPQDEDITEEELSLGDIDDEITLDEDLAVSDLDTLDTEEVADVSAPVEQKQDNAENHNQPQPQVETNKTIPMQEMSVDTLLDNAIAAIDQNKTEPMTPEVSDRVSDTAIKMTSVAGGTVEGLQAGVNKEDPLGGINKNHTNDYNSDVVMSATDDHMSFIGGLSDAKRQANMMAEAQGLTDKPKDMSELHTVEREKEETIVHEVVDMDSIQHVEREKFVEDESAIVEMDSIKDVDSPTKPAANIEELALQQVETETIELPDLNSYTINEDGTSPLDNMNWGPEEEVNSDELLDLDVAESLIGGAVNIGQTDYTDDLVDGTAFQTQDVIFDAPAPASDEITISEENSPTEDIVLPTEDVLDELVGEDAAPEKEDSVNEEKHPETSEQDNSPIEISEGSDEDIMNEEVIDELAEEPSAPKDTETSEAEQDWTGDIGYDTLSDVEPDTQPEEDTLDSIVEHSPTTTVYNAKSNSTVISDKTFKPGEINIDINGQSNPQPVQDDDTISSLYDRNSDVATNTILSNPGRLTQQKQKQSGGLTAGLGIAGALVVFVLLFAFGFGISKFIKGPTEEALQPISEDGGDINNNVAQQSAQPEGQVVEMDNNTNALASTAGTKAPTSPSSFVEVKKLSWEVPGAVSADPNFQQYFQSAGKSLKSALMTDLLSVSDKAYASEMRVSITYNQDGTFRDARIVTASGSNQIDNIVLRTVNQTLNVLKAPRSVGSYENTTAVLKIYL